MPRGLRRIAVLTAVAVLLWPLPLAAQRAVTVGTNPPGTAFYAIGSGLAKVASEAGALRMAVQPYTGSSTFLPLINTPGARLVMRGSPFLVGLLVRKDSPIRTIHDIRGKRVTGEYPAHLAVWYNMFGHLASAGLTWDDVRVVPVPAINEGLDALIQGRADVTEFALNAAKVREADAAVGVRHISTDCSPEGERRLRQAVPGYYPRWVKKGEAVAVGEDTCVIAYDVYVITGRSVPDPLVEALLRAVWDDVERLKPLHPFFKEWTRERMASAEVTLPYHPAAVRFYRERGAWTPEMDRAQHQLLSLNP